MLAGKPFLLCIGPNWEITVSTTNTSRPVVIVTRRSWLWVLLFFCACSWDGCSECRWSGCHGGSVHELKFRKHKPRQEEVRESSTRIPEGLGICGVTRSNAEWRPWVTSRDMRGPAYMLDCLGCLLGPNLQGLYTHTVPTGKLYCVNSPCWYIPLFENIVHLFTGVLDIFSASCNTLRFWAEDGWCLWTWSGVLPPIPQISDCGPWVFWREWACSHCTKLSGGCWLPPRDPTCLCNYLN